MSVEHLIIIRGGRRASRGGSRRPLDTTRRPDLLARRLRGGKQWRFYDIGTRLQTVDVPSTYASAGRALDDDTVPVLDGSKTFEYVELAMDAPGQFTDITPAVGVPQGEIDYYSFTSNHVQVAAADVNDLATWDAAMLGTGKALDPLAFSQLATNPSGSTDAPRQIPNCMPLWYGPQLQPGVADSEVIRVACSATAGTFTLSVTIGGKTGTTKPIRYNASALDVKTALQGMKSPIDVGDIASASGNLIDGIEVVFGGKLANYNMPAFTVDNTQLVGGTATVTVIQSGANAAPADDYIGAFDPTTYVTSADYNDNIFDVEAYTASKTDIYPNATYREIVADVARWWRFSESDSEFLQQTFETMVKVLNGRWKGEDLRQTGETWNTLNLTQNTYDLSQSGLMEMAKASGRVNVRLKSRLAFEPFDTGNNAAFKVTATPDYNAGAVPFTLTQNAETRFYLRPQLHAFAHKRDFQRIETVSYSSYRRYNAGVQLWFNHQTSASDTAPDPNVYATLTIDSSMSLVDGQDPDAGPYTFTVTATIDRTTGAYTLSGLHDGSNTSGTATFIPSPDPGFPGDWDLQYFGPNYYLRLQADEYRAIEGDTNNLTLSVSTAPDYSNQSAQIITSASVWRGAHIGRYPAFPLNVSSGGWVSQTLDLESVTQTFADGTTQTKTFADSVQMDGRELTLTFGAGSTARQVYTRRSNRDANDYVYYRPIVYLDFQPDTGQIAERLFSTSQIEWRKLSPIAGTQAALTAEAAAAAQDIKNQILAYDHVATISTVSTSVTFAEPSFGKRWIMLPIEAPAGTLCAVIVSGKNKYYVWRKTAESRGGYDHERSQGVATYSGSIT